MFTWEAASPYNGNMPEEFTSARVPSLVFRAGAIAGLPAVVKTRAVSRVGVVTGAGWFPVSEQWQTLQAALRDRGIALTHRTNSGEPSPGGVDEIAAAFRENGVELLIGIGGGSVLDTAKAAAVAVVAAAPIKDFLEGVGSREPDGRSLPVIAVPTSAGTGSEATKNAVLSEVGPQGFKKSLRHENFIPSVAVIDPELAISASPEVTAASGLDAITQLLEAYISTKSSVFTDSLAETGLRLAGRSFARAVQDGDDLVARGDMAYAAFLSGVCLANAGLGIVHGAASPAGAISSVPHGVFCGNMLLPAMEYTVRRLRQQGETSGRAAAKLTRAAFLLSDEDPATSDLAEAGDRLLDRLRAFNAVAPLSRLSTYGIDETMVDTIARGTGPKNTPVAVSQSDVKAMLMERL